MVMEPRRASGLPAKRLDAYRAGIIPMLWLLITMQSYIIFLNHADIFFPLPPNYGPKR